ncbi:MAG: glutamine amidotransferase, partial [Halobacteriaceae archaeon]
KLQANQYYAGAESFQVFHQRVRDYEPLLNALEGSSNVAITHLDGPDTMADFPRSVEALQAYDALIISDLSRGTLEPHFYPDAIPGPNLLRIIKQFVRDGGGLIYCGGWMTFQGYRGLGNWQGTPVDDVLPVEIQPIFDDRVERPEGGEVSIANDAHPITSHLDSESFPPVYGYNELTGVTDDGRLLATVDGHPLLVTGAFGDGRVVAYASDPGPKWGYGLMEWDGYADFWRHAVEWASGTE